MQCTLLNESNFNGRTHRRGSVQGGGVQGQQWCMPLGSQWTTLCFPSSEAP